MKISAKTDYACKALLELSLRWPNDTPVQISTIAKEQSIPMNFLTQIMLQLKQLGYVQSTRGKKGGYTLSKAPNTISIYDIIADFEGPEYFMEENGQSHVMDEIWSEVCNSCMQTLKELNFEIILTRKRNQDKLVTYNI